MIIKQATENEYNGIISLFERNYSHYHYEQILNYVQLSELFSRNFVGWVALDNNMVIGFAGLYSENNSIIKLAHLLIDENYRGHHLGSLLETEREKYCQKINTNIILVSCVEIPPQSMFLKKKHGFKFLGARVNYRPDSLNRGHSVLMGKYRQDIKPQKVEMPSALTKTLINSTCSTLECTREFIENESKSQDIYEIIADDKLGRKTAYFQHGGNNNALLLPAAIRSLIECNLPYVSITLNILNNGFCQADSLLIDNGFIPVIYVPNYDSGFDLLEYQYMGSAEKREYESLIEKLKEQKIYEDCISICAI